MPGDAVQRNCGILVPAAKDKESIVRGGWLLGLAALLVTVTLPQAHDAGAQAPPPPPPSSAGAPQGDEFNNPSFQAPFNVLCGTLAESPCPDVGGPSTWSLDDPQLSPGNLRLTTLPGSQLFPFNNARDLVLQPFNPGADWVATTKLTFPMFPPDPGTSRTPLGQAAGMLVYQDDINFIYVARQFDALAQSATIDFVQEVVGVNTVGKVSENCEFNCPTIYLRIEKVGTTYSAWYSYDNESFSPVPAGGTMAGSSPSAGYNTSYTSPLIGLFAWGGTNPAVLQSGNTLKAFFDWFRVGDSTVPAQPISYTPSATSTLSPTPPPSASPTPTSTPAPQPPLQPIIPKTTKVLGTSALHKLLSPNSKIAAAAANLTLKFRNPGATIKALKPGDVIASGITKQTPDGMLRKVTAVLKSGKREMVRTVPATLAQAVPQGSLDLRINLSHPTSTRFRSLIRGAKMTPHSPRSGPPCVTLPQDTQLYKAGAVTVKASGQACYDGTLTFTPSWSFISRGYFNGTFSTAGTVTTALNIKISGGLDIIAPPPVTIGEFEDVILIPTGYLPVVVVVDIPLEVGFDAHVSASATQYVRSAIPVQGQIACNPIECTPSGSVGTPRFTSTKPDLARTGSIEAYALIETKLLFYSLAGPSLETKGYLKLTADTSKNPWWELHAGIDVTGKGVFQFLGIALETGQLDLFLLDRTLDKAPGSWGTPTPTVPPTPTSTPTLTPGPTPTSTRTPTTGSDYLSLSPTSGPPGSNIFVTWHDFDNPSDNPGVIDNVLFDGTAIGSFTTDQTESFSGTVTIPTSAAPGDHTISSQFGGAVTSDDSDDGGSATFTVTSASPDRVCADSSPGQVCLSAATGPGNTVALIVSSTQPQLGGLWITDITQGRNVLESCPQVTGCTGHVTLSAGEISYPDDTLFAGPYQSSSNTHVFEAFWCGDPTRYSCIVAYGHTQPLSVTWGG